MSIIRSHTRPKEERKSKSLLDNKHVKRKDYEYVESILVQCICDIINGLQKSDVMQKLENQLYDGQRQPYTYKTAEMYYYTAMQRIREDREAELEELKDKLYAQYYSLYADAVKSNNTFAAKQVLDSIAKVFVNDTKKNIDVTVDNNNDVVSISFGFDAE